jgi:hypothetical protein
VVQALGRFFLFCCTCMCTHDNVYHTHATACVVSHTRGKGPLPHLVVHEPRCPGVGCQTCWDLGTLLLLKVAGGLVQVLACGLICLPLTYTAGWASVKVPVL